MYSYLNRVLADAGSIPEAHGIIVDTAQVEMTWSTHKENGQTVFDIEDGSVRLLLDTDLDEKYLNDLPDDSTVEVTQGFEDGHGHVTTVTFKFQVHVTERNPQAVGADKLKYEAELLDYQVAD